MPRFGVSFRKCNRPLIDTGETNEGRNTHMGYSLGLKGTFWSRFRRATRAQEGSSTRLKRSHRACTISFTLGAPSVLCPGFENRPVKGETRRMCYAGVSVSLRIFVSQPAAGSRLRKISERCRPIFQTNSLARSLARSPTVWEYSPFIDFARLRRDIDSRGCSLLRLDEKSAPRKTNKGSLERAVVNDGDSRSLKRERERDEKNWKKKRK